MHDRLAAQAVFAGCSRADIRELARAGDECAVPAGTVLCREGWIGYWLFVVLSGAVQLRREGGAAGSVATLRAGSHFGDVAIIGFGPQPMTAVVTEDAVVFVLGRRHVLDLVHTMPGLRRGLFPEVASEAELVAVVRELRAAGSDAWKAMPRRAVAELLAGDRVEQLPPSVVAVPRRRRAGAGGSAASPFAVALRLVGGEVGGDGEGASGGAGRLPVVVPPLDRRTVVGLVAVVAVVLATFATSFHPDVLVVRPSATIDVTGDVVVSGVASHPPRGRYVVTAVDIEQTNVVGLALAAVRGEQILRRAHGATGAGSDPSGAGRASYRASQQAAAALVLARGVGADPSGVSVRVRDRELTGPSAGLLYALVVADMTDVVSVPAGRVVAATGELDTDGRVRPVSFVDEKRTVARRAGATIFLVPDGSPGAEGRRARGPAVVSVSTLDEALAAVGS